MIRRFILEQLAVPLADQNQTENDYRNKLLVDLMKRIVITGSSGYLGSRLVDNYRKQDVEVIGIDVVSPSSEKGDGPGELTAPDVFEQCDICDPKLKSILTRYRPNAVIHSAFVFQPMRNRKKMHRINVEGTRNLLDAIAHVELEHLCVVSSATAYGAWPDNPVPMDESAPIRARPEFQYSADKGKVEQLLADFVDKESTTVVSWVRPAIIGGPNFDNYLRRFVFGMPFLVMSDGVDTPMQFVHENDVVSAIALIVQSNGTGAYNIAPDDWSSIQEIAKVSNRRAVKWPFWLTRLIHGFAWAIRLPFHESPAGFLYYARYPWVVKSSRLKEELGFEFQYSNYDTLMEIVGNEK